MEISWFLDPAWWCMGALSVERAVTTRAVCNDAGCLREFQPLGSKAVLFRDSRYNSVLGIARTRGRRRELLELYLWTRVRWKLLLSLPMKDSSRRRHRLQMLAEISSTLNSRSSTLLANCGASRCR